VKNRSIIPSELISYYVDWRMSPGLVCNGLLFMTGMTGHRPDGTFADDPAEQIRAAFAKIDSVLAEAALDRSSIVEMTSFHVGLQAHIEIFRTLHDQYVVEPYPAWTAIEVSGLASPDAIVEIRVVASALP
jgi:enamine deaminase RidA (YjgF/YER057c/UK114 family)